MLSEPGTTAPMMIHIGARKSREPRGTAASHAVNLWQQLCLHERFYFLYPAYDPGSRRQHYRILL